MMNPKLQLWQDKSCHKYDWRTQSRFWICREKNSTQCISHLVVACNSAQLQNSYQYLQKDVFRKTGDTSIFPTSFSHDCFGFIPNIFEFRDDSPKNLDQKVKDTLLCSYIGSCGMIRFHTSGCRTVLVRLFVLWYRSIVFDTQLDARIALRMFTSWCFRYLSKSITQVYRQQIFYSHSENKT